MEDKANESLLNLGELVHFLQFFIDDYGESVPVSFKTGDEITGFTIDSLMAGPEGVILLGDPCTGDKNEV